MTAPVVNSSPSDRPSPSLISPSPCTTWGTNLGLHPNVLHDHIRPSAPKFYGINSGKLVSMMNSAAGTVTGAAALKAARTTLAHSAELHAQISSIQGQRKSPQTLEIYRYSIHIFCLQDRVTLVNARSPPHTPNVLQMVL